MRILGLDMQLKDNSFILSYEYCCGRSYSNFLDLINSSIHKHKDQLTRVKQIKVKTEISIKNLTTIKSVHFNKFRIV